ncbi:MAG: SufE family protein [Paracoccaceae bacterium]|jgi:cysteine desulfuration protein SufE
MASDAFEALVEDFEFLEDWEDRYRAVIDEGKAMADMEVALKVDANKVHGCASQVWLHTYIEDGILRFDGDSDAMIVKGLIAILHKLYNDQAVRDVAQTDALEQMGRLGLNDHLSAQRSNGLRAMIERLQADARGAL